MTEVEIRVLTSDDVEAYWQCRLEALERDPEAFSSSVEDHLKLTRDEIRRRLTADPINNFVLGVFAKDQLFGDGRVRARATAEVASQTARTRRNGQTDRENVLLVVFRFQPSTQPGKLADFPPYTSECYQNKTEKLIFKPAESSDRITYFHVRDM